MGWADSCDTHAVSARRLLLLGTLLSLSAGVAVLACSGGNWCGTWGSDVLCDDFDKTGAATQEGLPQGSTVGEAGGTTSINNVVFYTPPNSALLSTGPFDAGAGSGALLTGALWSGAQSPRGVLTCQVQIQVASASDGAPLVSTVQGDTSSVFTLALTEGSGAPFANLGFIVDTVGNLYFVEQYPGDPSDSGDTFDGGIDGGADGASLDGAFHDAARGADALDTHPADGGNTLTPGSMPLIHPLSAALSVGEWALLQMQFTASSTTLPPPAAQFVASVALQGANGTQSASGTLAQPFPSTIGASLIVGPADSNIASSGWSFYFDDVVCY
jgi:hypothetical protein